MIKNLHSPVCHVAIVATAIFVLVAGCDDENPVAPMEDPVEIDDTFPPSAINSLIVQTATRSTLALQWISPGDDSLSGQASAYDIRYHDIEITEDNWDLATRLDDPPLPKPGRSVEVLVVKNLFSSQRYYFAIKTADEVPNESALSNCADGTTAAEYVPPAPVADLRAQAISDSEFLLTWTATGDDRDLPGTASVYDIRYSDSPVLPASFVDATHINGEPDPSPMGETDSLLVGGLTAGTDYFFAMKVGDELPNWSKVSNMSIGLALDQSFLVYPLTIVNLDNPLLILFRTTSATQVAKVTVSSQHYIDGEWEWIVERQLVRPARFDPAAHEVYWDFRDDDGVLIPWAFQQLRIDFYLDGQLIDSQDLRRR